MRKTLLLLLLNVATAFAEEVKKPNILFILTEDQGAHLSFLGTPGLKTPNMDALARNGVYFTNAFVTYPVCSASKAALYTSLPNHMNGLVNNTLNYHQSAEDLKPTQKNAPLYIRNRIHPEFPTLVERLRDAGYYQGVTHKLHVAPNEKFPYDEFIKGESKNAVSGFLKRAAGTQKPWFLFYNVGASHRPFPNSDKVKIRVNPAEVELPAFLPDTPLVRQDWAEYLAAVERADHLIGGVMAALKEAGQDKNTIIVCLGGDHGPAFPHGKLTLYDLGLRVTLSISGPEVLGGVKSAALVSGLDLAPTLLDMIGEAPFQKSLGISLKPILAGDESAKGHEFIVAEISNRGELAINGMEERAIFDGRWKLILRSLSTPLWRQVQADTKDMKPWGNRSYGEIVKGREQFPDAYRILSEMYPQELGGKTPEVELYDLKNDPDEMKNLASDSKLKQELLRLTATLRQWSAETGDSSMKWDHAPE
ncbi:MAG: sulfatase [Akkermansiaceae bacterium]|jgi:N-sulfoglucosamine sulfohydrolase|nr:sulfatase [Akkermansiaceae bacterium]MDP4897998.1 sulfatase [Akkermansiaceae bacterium]